MECNKDEAARAKEIAEKKFSVGDYDGAQRDWYGILGVNPAAPDDTIRNQYRALVLTLHPDKNKSSGAEGAFKLVSEAWSILSDKTKRLAYNKKRSLCGFQHNAPNHVLSQTQSKASTSNGACNHRKNATSDGRSGKNKFPLFVGSRS